MKLEHLYDYYLSLNYWLQQMTHSEVQKCEYTYFGIASLLQFTFNQHK
jgi:hypothetical protein